MDYLRDKIRKPPALSPAEFRLLFESAEQLAIQLPDAPANNSGFTDDERKRYYYEVYSPYGK